MKYEWIYQNIKVLLEEDRGLCIERYFALEGSLWQPVCVCGTRHNGDLTIQCSEPGFSIFCTAEGVRIRKSVTPCRDRQGFLKVESEYTSSESVHSLFDLYRFCHDPDTSFAPSLGGFIPDGQYKAPLVMAQYRNIMLGIIPDVASLDKETLARCGHFMELNLTGEPILRVGYCPSKVVSHAIYSEDPERTWKPEGPVVNRYYLNISAESPEKEGYRSAVRFHWEVFGRNNQPYAAAAQRGNAPSTCDLTSFESWRRFVWQSFSEENWVSFSLPGGVVGGAVKTVRYQGVPSVYMTSWFNSVRTALGMALYARRCGDTRALHRASETVRLALSTPEKNGAFPCFVLEHENSLFWGAGDGHGRSTPEGYLGYDMSWSGTWLLRWREASLPFGDEILDKCTRLADFFLARQRSDGQFPTFYGADAEALEEKLPYTLAETGPVSLFLLTLYRAHQEPRFLESALKGLRFIEEAVTPQRKWFDFETFWSCSTAKKEYDPVTRQHPANNLALIQTVDAYATAYEITGDKAFLEKGEGLLSYLLLYQQCWTNPMLLELSCEHMLLGGFTTQNTDAEWSDARQSQCGNLLLRYYRATGRAEYLERGIAALRAQFPVSPSENWAHIGYGGREGVSSFHWGTGSGMAGIELEEDFLRDGIVDMKTGTAVGVNGIDLTALHIASDRVSFTMTTPFELQPKTIRFLNVPPCREYAVTVNGKNAGSYTSDALCRGIELNPWEKPIKKDSSGVNS